MPCTTDCLTTAATAPCKSHPSIVRTDLSHCWLRQIPAADGIRSRVATVARGNHPWLLSRETALRGWASAKRAAHPVLLWQGYSSLDEPLGGAGGGNGMGTDEIGGMGQMQGDMGMPAPEDVEPSALE